jgi:3-methyladenine DNA glycosylase AlkD
LKGEEEQVMKAREADELGGRIAELVHSGHTTKAYTLLAPVLAERTPFRLLGRVGEAIGTGPLSAVNAFLKKIAEARTEGGWVVIGSALSQQLGCDFAGALDRCRTFVIAADVWYATDILGERVPGPAMLADMCQALNLLAPWRVDTNRWVRRTIGVGAHFWAKRSRGAPECALQAQALLTFLEPMFQEQDADAIKGVGWGLKTLGKYYPELVADWLVLQVTQHRGRYRALMLRKALTYLPVKHRARIARDIA